MVEHTAAESRAARRQSGAPAAERKDDRSEARLLLDLHGQLAEIAATANGCADEILSLCEGLLEIAPSLPEGKARQAVERAAAEIMSACSFDDLIGQATRSASGKVEMRLKALPLEPAGPAAKAHPKEIPGREARARRQAEADRLFAAKS